MRKKTQRGSVSLLWFVLVLTAFAVGGCDFCWTCPGKESTTSQYYSCGSCQCQTSDCWTREEGYTYCDWVKVTDPVCASNIEEAGMRCKARAIGKWQEIRDEMSTGFGTSVSVWDYKCPANQMSKIADECPSGTLSFPLLSQLPKPDLSYANLDGVVDFGRSALTIDLVDGDRFTTALKGRVAIVGEICPQSTCPLQVVLAELSSLQDHFTSAKGRSVSGFSVRNANAWTGRKPECVNNNETLQ